MIQIMLTPEQQRLFDESTESVQIVDLNGRILTRFETGVTEEEIAEAQRIAASFDDLRGTEHGLSAEDLDRIAGQSQNFRPATESIRELLDRLKAEYPTEAVR